MGRAAWQLVNDLGALNKVEIGDWDWCDLLRVEPLDQPNTEVDGLLDVMASLVVEGESLAAPRDAFEHEPAVRPPDDVVRRASAS